MKKLFLLIFLLFLIFPVLAQPPQQFSGLGGLEIKFPIVEHLEIGSSHEFEFHVFNGTSGMPINTGVSCYFHLYNQTGKHIDEGYDSTASHTYDYSYELNGANFTQKGMYNLIAQCNTTTEGGFAEFGFDVNSTGFELTVARALIFLGLLSILIITLMVTTGAIALLPSGDNRDEEGTLLSINQLKYFRPVLYVFCWFLVMSIMFVASNIALAYLGTELIGNIFHNIYIIMMSLSLPMLVVWFLYILTSIFQDKKMKGYLERGVIDDTI